MSIKRKLDLEETNHGSVKRLRASSQEDIQPQDMVMNSLERMAAEAREDRREIKKTLESLLRELQGMRGGHTL